MEMDKIARAAMEANTKPALGDRFRSFLENMPGPVSILVTIAALGGLLAATYWEGNNSGGGWIMLGKGVASPWICWTAGAGFTLLYFAFHRIASEALRDYGFKTAKFIKPALAGMIFGTLSVAGVFANLVHNAEGNRGDQQEIAAQRGELSARVKTLETRINYFDEIGMKAALTADERALQAMIGEAVGWGLDDLDPDGGCVADLKPRPRELCNIANGPDGIRASIDATAAAIESNEQAKDALELAKAALAAVPKAEGANFWEGVAQVFKENNAETALVFFMLAVSIMTIFATGLGWDALFEAREPSPED
jgi:hypothetical protein